jgi:hypothetical protein
LHISKQVHAVRELALCAPQCLFLCDLCQRREVQGFYLLFCMGVKLGLSQ